MLRMVEWKNAVLPLDRLNIMNKSEKFTDIHCHLLPGLDDGPSGWEESLKMAAMAAADGIGTIVATPHQLGNYQKNSAEKINTHVAQLRHYLQQYNIVLDVLPGADVRIDPELPRMVQRGDVLTLADRRRHVLLELPHEVYIPLDMLLAQLHSTGVTGILSHPERNQGILNQPNVLLKLIEQGCLLQITAGSLLGLFGTKIQKFATTMIEQGIVDFVASDAHGTTSRMPVLSHAFHRVVELTDHDTAVKLFCRNPACVAAGTPVPPRMANRQSKHMSFRPTYLFNTSRQFVRF
jgi:protein-tyrosine phosphatase